VFPLAELNLVGLVVDDMAATLAFYRALGLDIPADADGEGHVEVVTGGMRLAWDTAEVVRSFDPDWAPPPSGRRISLAFSCDSSDDVDSTYQTLVDAGYEGHKAPWDAFWGQRYAVVKDPDGNHVDLFH